MSAVPRSPHPRAHKLASQPTLSPPTRRPAHPAPLQDLTNAKRQMDPAELHEEADWLWAVDAAVAALGGSDEGPAAHAEGHGGGGGDGSGWEEGGDGGGGVGGGEGAQGVEAKSNAGGGGDDEEEDRILQQLLLEHEQESAAAVAAAEAAASVAAGRQGRQFAAGYLNHKGYEPGNDAGT